MTGAGDIHALEEFLRAHPPFDALDGHAVRRVAASAQPERFAAGAVVFEAGDAPLAHLRVVREGAVELVAEGRVLDLVVEGEMFGHASMLSGLPAGFTARAAQDTLCLRIPVAAAQAALAAPAGLRFVARSLVGAPPALVGAGVADEPVASLLTAAPVVCSPETTVRAAAQQMAAARVTCVIVDRGRDGLGIVTDHDLRTRVLARGLSSDRPVAEVMTAPAYTCTADRSASEAMLEMVDRGFRHLPVVTATGQVVGVVEDTDLLVARARSSLSLRQRIAAARDPADVARAASELGPMVIALHDGGVAACNVMAVYSGTVDAITRRLLELALAARGDPGVPFAWLALGSQARREALPASDVDSAIVWFGEDGDAAPRSRLLELARTVTDGLQACGLTADSHGASANDPLFVRSLASWQRLIAGWISDPTQEKALILSSTLVDSRPLWGVHTGVPVADSFALAPHSSDLLRMLARFALSYRPPTGFLRGLVVEHGGEHRGRLDLKHGGAVPIVDLARWAGMAAGVTIASTRERLRAADGVLPGADVRTLLDAFTLICELRTAHQAGALRAGRQPDDHLDPADLSPLMRTQLKDAFRAVAAVQKRLHAELSHVAG